MIDKCIQLAKKNPAKFKLAAIITDKKGRIVSKALNSFSQTHPQQALYAAKVGKPKAIYLHSEIAALVASKGRGHTLYVVRVDSEGNLKMAKPCTICEMAIKAANIREVYYSEDNSTIKRWKLND